MVLKTPPTTTEETAVAEPERAFKLDQVLTITGGHFVHDTYSGFIPALLPLIQERLATNYALTGGLAVYARLPSLLNPFLHVGGGLLGDLPAWFAAWAMFAGQAVFNFFVTSGSGQAALTMPLIAPLSDFLGVSRQVAVLAFQLGDGLTNLLVPTSAALMACLGAARVDWQDWIGAMLRFVIGLLLLASVFVLIAVAIGYQ